MTNIRTKITYAVAGLVFATALPIAYAAVSGNDILPGQIASRHIVPAGLGAAAIADDSLDYTEMKDALTLDAATTLTCPAALSYTEVMSGTGDRVINLSSTADFVVQDNAVPAFTVNDSGNVTLAGSQTNSALGLGLVHASATGLFSSSTLATGDIAAGAVTAPKLQSAAADLGAANVTVNFGNTNGAFDTNITTDGSFTATGGFVGNASTSTALAADPADCGAGTVARSIAASGVLTCSAVATGDFTTDAVTGDALAETITWDAETDVTLSAGAGTTNGKALYLYGSDAGAGNGGAITIEAGSPLGGATNGGPVTITATAALTTGNGADVTINAGSAPGNGTGGKVILNPATSASGTAGYVDIGGTTALGATLDPVVYGYFTNLNAQDLVVMAPNTATTGTLADVNWGVATTQTGALNAAHIDATNLTVDAISQYNGLKISDPANAAAGVAYGLYMAGTNWDYGIYSDDDVYIGGNLDCAGGCVGTAEIATGAVTANEMSDLTCMQTFSVVFDPTEAGAVIDYVPLLTRHATTGIATVNAVGGAGPQFMVARVGMNINNLYATVDAAPGVGKDAWSIFVKDDAVDTAVTCVIDEGATTCNSGALTAVTLSGSLLEIKVTSDVGGGADPELVTTMRVSFCLGQ